MSMLQKSRHWLAPLSIMLLGSPVLPTSADSTSAVEIPASGTSIRADKSGDIHLRISRDLITGSPENLREALLDVILNGKNHSARPASIDDDGKIHYLVSFGQNEASSEIHLKPLPAETRLEDAIADAVTGLSTILTLSVVDGITRWRKANAEPYLNLNTAYRSKNIIVQEPADAANNLPETSIKHPKDNYAKGLARSYASHATLVSSFFNGGAVSGLTSHALGPNDTGRTSWADILPDLTSTLTMGFSGGALHYLSDYSKIDDMPHQVLGEQRTVLSHVSLYNMSSTTNTLTRMIRKAHEALLNDVTSLDDYKVEKIAQVAPILEGALALTALNYSGYAGPSLEGKTLRLLP